MTPTQLANWKADIAVNTNETPQYPGIQIKDLTISNSDHADAIARWYNVLASPVFYGYRTSIPFAEIMLNGFAWAEVDNLLPGKARIWEWMRDATDTHTLDASKPNVRAGINEVWVGSAPKVAVRAAVYAHCTRSATILEKLLKAAGAGTAPDTTGEGPATFGFEGSAYYSDLS